MLPRRSDQFSAVSTFAKRCHFSVCQEKHWLHFSSDQALHDHIVSTHKCQWLLSTEQGFKPCEYLPSSHEDLINHVEQHISSGEIIVVYKNEQRRLLCPWQTCTSAPYILQGCRNRANLSSHIRNHLAFGPKHSFSDSSSSNSQSQVTSPEIRFKSPPPVAQQTQGSYVVAYPPPAVIQDAAPAQQLQELPSYQKPDIKNLLSPQEDDEGFNF